jgi:hypothetical protein
MTKYIVRLEADRIKCFKIKKATRQLVTLHGRLYRNDDCLYVKDKHTSDAYRITPIDSNQVGKPKTILVNPDDTRAIIMSKEISGQKKKAWFNMDASKLWQVFLMVIVGGSILYGLIVSGVF